MRALLKSSFLWQFVGGFAIGAVGLVAVQSADAMHMQAKTPTQIEANR